MCMSIPKQKLTINDFELLDPGYYSYLTDNYEICLEKCMNGYEVALYDLKQQLLQPKVCTDINNEYLLNRQSYTLRKAIEIANQINDGVKNEISD